MKNWQSLYRTYRPQSFDQIIGQEYVVTVLKNAISKQRISHAYVFSGPHGTGKTSLARIFAKTINDESAKQESVDIIEIDAASNNGVDDVRTLINNSSYVPAIARYKVYIIDEAHMLTKGAWNALLKTLEEPPAHVVIILATTEIAKIPATILSRCQKLNFRLLGNDIIMAELMRILTAEKIQFEEKALVKIATLSNGSMRDALSLTEQIVMAGEGTVSMKTINSALGLVDKSVVIKLINELAANGLTDALKTFNDFYAAGASVSELLNTMLELGRDWLIWNKTGSADLLISNSEDEINNLHINEEFAQILVDEILKLKINLRILNGHRELFEIFLLHVAKKSTNFMDVLPLQENGTKPPKLDFTTLTPQNGLEMDASRTSFVVKLLSAASKQKLRKRHEKWEMITQLAQNDDKFNVIKILFSKVKLIAAGTNFVLIVGEEAAVNDIRSRLNDQLLISFTQLLWGEPLYVFAITENQFLIARDLWLKLNSNNTLPAPAVIPVPHLDELGN